MHCVCGALTTANCVKDACWLTHRRRAQLGACLRKVVNRSQATWCVQRCALSPSNMLIYLYLAQLIYLYLT